MHAGCGTQHTTGRLACKSTNPPDLPLKLLHTLACPAVFLPLLIRLTLSRFLKTGPRAGNTKHDSSCLVILNMTHCMLAKVKLSLGSVGRTTLNDLRFVTRLITALLATAVVCITLGSARDKFVAHE